MEDQQKQKIQGEIADYYLDESGILYSFSKSIKRTVENIAGNIALVKRITQGKRVPLLIFLCNSPMPDKATRKFASEQLSTVYSAMAMVSKPGLSALIMKVLFSFQQPPIPMKSFTDQTKAKQWLEQFL